MKESTKKPSASTTAFIPATSEVDYLLERTLPFADKLYDLVANLDTSKVDDLDLIISLAAQLQENLEEAVELSQGRVKTWQRADA